MLSETDATHRAIEAVWRHESAKIVARVTRLIGDLSVAEDLAQDALLAALEQWPQSGVPDNPGAWLTTIAKRRAVDLLRRRTLSQQKNEQVAQEIEVDRPDSTARFDDALDDPIGDDLLRLIFMCCHPVLATEARVALTLRLLGGLSTEEIARAFLVPVPTVAQRIVRAKRTLSNARVPFELPPRDELASRLGSVLEVIYLIFNEGYSATEGEHWTRPALCSEAIRLGGILAELEPDEHEVLGLLALMQIHASRLKARVDATGHPILLLDQDRARWDKKLIDQGLHALARAQATGPGGAYTLQAAIAACHARAPSAEQTDWPEIASWYDLLYQVKPTPIVALNRAVAIGMARGAAAGLEAIDQVAAEPVLVNYHILPSVRADFLAKLGRTAEARAELERAVALAGNQAERELLLRRLANLAN